MFGPPPYIAPPIESGAATDDAACPKDLVKYTSEGQLPPGVLTATRLRMADTGQPYESTDALSGRDLPRYQFVSAYQRDCSIRLYYNQGGRVKLTRYLTLVLERGPGGANWVMSPTQ